MFYNFNAIMHYISVTSMTTTLNSDKKSRTLSFPLINVVRPMCLAISLFWSPSSDSDDDPAELDDSFITLLINEMDVGGSSRLWKSVDLEKRVQYHIMMLQLPYGEHFYNIRVRGNKHLMRIPNVQTLATGCTELG